jgi:hypothetical protein
MYAECRIGWSYEFIHKNLGKLFAKRYLTAVTDFLYTKETALLPQTKVLAEKVKKYITKQGADGVNNIIVKVLTKYGEKVSNAPKFYGFCPMKNCEGTLTEAFVCSLCKCKTCAQCRKEIPHSACSKEDLDAVKLFEKFRPCPTCKTPIEKTAGGCDEMFCVKCHTSFSWATGSPIKKEKMVHNPHRYEWLRENKQEIPTSTEPNIEEEIIKLNTLRTEVAQAKAKFVELTGLRKKAMDEKKSAEEIAGLAIKSIEESDKFIALQNEVRKQDMYVYVLESKRDNIMLAKFVQSAVKGHPQFGSIGTIATTVDNIQYNYLPIYEDTARFDNTDLRIKFLLNRIDEDRFKFHLCCRFLFKQRLASVKMILASFVESANIIFNGILMRSVVENSPKLKAPTEVVDKMLQDLEALREFTEKSLTTLESVYGSSCLKFDKTWEFEDNERYNKMGILRPEEKVEMAPFMDLGPIAIPPGANLQEAFNNIVQALIGSN